MNENEVIGRSILTMGVYDLIVAESLKRLLSPDDLFLDVGANIGYFSRQALRFGAQIRAFEPHPQIFAHLQKNLGGFEGKCQLYNSALSDQKGEFSLYIPENFSKNEGVASLEPMDNSTELKVQTEKLDSMSPGKVRLMKIDVEGHELQVLKGAEQLLKNKAIEFIVFEDFGGAQSKCIQFLQKYGYEVKRLQKTLMGPRLLDLNNINKLPKWEPPNFIATANPNELETTFTPKGWKFYS